MKPRLVDLYCCLGGASTGYARAGFEVVGVDIEPQPDYPFEFHRSDAIGLLAEHSHEFDAAAGSPPCQASSGPTKGTNKKRNAEVGRVHVDLIPATRRALDNTGLPYVIENVQGSELRRDLTLCGLMFGLRVYRHRYFELGGWSMAPRHCRPGVDHRGHRVRGWRHGEYFEGDMLAIYGNGGGKATVEECREGLGIDWSWDRERLIEAIPPAYTEFIGRELLAHVEGRVAA